MITCVTETYVKKEDSLLENKPKASYLTIIKDKGVVITVLLYALEALLQCSFDSLVSLWLSSSREDGGFAFNVKEIGWFISCVCPMQMGNCISSFYNNKISCFITYSNTIFLSS